jgi:hypothetical protein
MAWEAVFAFILGREDLANRIRTITDEVLYYTGEYKTDRVKLPSSVAGVLDIDRYNGWWLLGEKVQKVKLRPGRTLVAPRPERPADPIGSSAPSANLTGPRPGEAAGRGGQVHRAPGDMTAPRAFLDNAPRPDASQMAAENDDRLPQSLGDSAAGPAVESVDRMDDGDSLTGDDLGGDQDLGTVLRAAGLTAIADYLDTGELPQIQLTEGMWHQLQSVSGPTPLGEAIDRLFIHGGIQVLDADGRNVFGGDAVADGPESRFVIDTGGKVLGPYAVLTGPDENGDWQKSSFSRGDCVEVAVF